MQVMFGHGINIININCCGELFCKQPRLQNTGSLGLKQVFITVQNAFRITKVPKFIVVILSY